MVARNRAFPCIAAMGCLMSMTYGATDDFSYNITENPVHVHDLQARFCTCWDSITNA